MPEKAIVLVGPMGVGKTTIGKKLAKTLNIPFTDTDQRIVLAHGPIDAFFEQHGEPAFRLVEEEALKEALLQPGVVSTGGGVVTSEACRDLLAGHIVIYLSTDGKHMASRLRKSTRPLLKNGLSDWTRIYNQRRALYEEVSDHEVDASGSSLAEIVQEVRERLSL